MAFTIKFISLLGFISVVSSASTFNPTQKDDYNSESYDSAPSDSYALPPQLPLTFELPREEAPAVPFYSPEPSTELKAPEYIVNPADYYRAPIPSQDLVAPIETVWNPNNDPKFYYEVPAILTKQDLPTNEYPKKFNKEIHSKDKPYSSRPKQEIVLEPINELTYVNKQKDLQKVFHKLAKQENQKVIESEKVQGDNTNIPSPFKTNPKAVEQDTAATGVLHQDLTPALSVHSHGVSSNGERLDFHMVGHDGPYSYKWGYDTGKGHNRQFRFEERDKEGIVKGHYGFYDKHGKLQMVNYDSHPESGFHAESNLGKQ